MNDYQNYQNDAYIYRMYIDDGRVSDRILDGELEEIKRDLYTDMLSSPDYHMVKRNGNPQGVILTRGGERSTYNVVCLPGDQLYAGDHIEAFGQNWIVMVANADDTTHKTGIMQQCNHLFRFQNGTNDIIERYGFIDVSGYSAAINNNPQLHMSTEQMCIYLSYDEYTKKIFVDKRLSIGKIYDLNGNEILNVVRVTGVNQTARSFNDEDHLLVLKTEQDLFAQDRDRVDEEICDYVSEDVNPPVVTPTGSCKINGRNTLRVGKKYTYTASFYDSDGNEIEPPRDVKWSVTQLTGVDYVYWNNELLIGIAEDQKLIGTIIEVSVTTRDGLYGSDGITVEVIDVV